jgi:hypothetical protein
MKIGQSITAIAFVFALVLLVSNADVSRADQYFYNVHVTVATQSSWGTSQPIRWTASGTWFVGSVQHVAQACVLAVYPYGSTLSNGYIEFPGLVGDIGSLAYRCNSQLIEGSCVYIDGVILSSPDTFGQTVIVTALYGC